ncbi:MAG: DUF1800 family protein [Pirellulaceae bacterium]
MSVATQQDMNADPDRAWSPYEPDAERPWTKRLAAHLYRRAAFGATWEQLEQAVSSGPQATVTRLLQPDADVAKFNQSVDEYEEGVSKSGNLESLRAWWLRRMIETPHPLLEKMTLFWHGHFGVSNVRVASPLLMARHLSMLREYALADYRPMLSRVANDPAVFLALDAGSNRRALPNETLARQFLDALAMGPGTYGDEDVRETARAFTGWFVLRGSLRFFPREHDDGEKNVLGEKGNWTAEDVVRIVLDRPATPQLLVRKFYRFLVSEAEPPGDELLEPLATSFASDYNVPKVLEIMLRSNIFYSPTAYRQRIKSPVDLAVGLIRALEGSVPTLQLGKDLGELGQSLYEPPTPKGWPGGRHWINSATLVGRQNLVQSMLAPKGPYKGKLDPLRVVQKQGRKTTESVTGFLAELLLQDDLPNASRKALVEATPGKNATSSWVREMVYGFATLPEFQMS